MKKRELIALVNPDCLGLSELSIIRKKGKEELRSLAKLRAFGRIYPKNINEFTIVNKKQRKIRGVKDEVADKIKDENDVQSLLFEES